MEVTIALKQIDSWETGVSIGTDLKADLDQTHLNLGILALHLCPIRAAGGRETNDTRPTISALAKEIGIDRSWLSNACSNAEFFGGVYDQIPPQATIGLLNKSRKVVEWKTGKKPTQAQVKKAIRFLEGAVDEPATIPPTAIAQVRSARKKLAKALEHEEPLGDIDKGLVEKAKDKLDEVDANNPEEE